VELVVADHGPGVPPELRERIFQPYFTTKRRATDGEVGPGWGTGLGLAIVDAVARSTGASVSIGDRTGGGAEFRVRWPATAVVHDVPPLPRETGGSVSPALVLLADNEVALVGAVARQLRRLGHSVYAAMSAAECRRLFDQYRDSIDVAVLDVKLGDGDGRELAEIFRGQRPDLGIVLMSASRTALGSSHPSTRSLVKPFDVRELTLAIERARADARDAHAPL
jgi:CheY-like chemotaxis protein